MESENHMSQSKAGPENQAVLALIDAAGTKGIGTEEIVKKTGYKMRSIESYIKAQRIGRKIAMALPPGSRDQRYVSAANYAKLMGGTFKNLPPPTTSVTIIKTAGARNSTISRERLSIEGVLDAALKPIPVELISMLADVAPPKVREILQRMLHDGSAKTSGGRDALWQATGKAAQIVRAPRVCNASMPTMREGLYPQPARADASDHLQIMSRRGDQLVPAMPPMLIGSGIGGGMR
jgi:hypothetical protein